MEVHGLFCHKKLS